MEPAEKKRILDELGNIPEELYNELVDCFLADIPKKIEQLKTAIQNGNYKSIKAVSHGIKGVSANLRLDKLYELSRELELAGSNNEELAGIEKKFRIFLEAIDSFSFSWGRK